MKDVDDDLEGNQGVDAGKGRETITSCIDEGLKVSEPSILTGGGAWQGIVARTAAERACRRKGENHVAHWNQAFAAVDPVPSGKGPLCAKLSRKGLVRDVKTLGMVDWGSPSPATASAECRRGEGHSTPRGRDSGSHQHIRCEGNTPCQTLKDEGPVDIKRGMGCQVRNRKVGGEGQEGVDIARCSVSFSSVSPKFRVDSKTVKAMV